MPLHRPARTALAAVGLLAGTAVVGNVDPAAPAAAATPAMPAAFPALPDSDSIDARPLVSGTITSQAGKRPNGGYVLVFALPSQAVIEASARPGGRYDLTPVSRATVEVDGTFTARLAPTVDLSRYRADGFVNFEAWAVSGDQLGSWGFSRTVSPSGELLSESGDSIITTVPLPAGRRGSQPSAGSSGAASVATPSVRIVTQRAPKTLSTSDTAAAFGCSYVGPRYNNRSVVLGQIYHYNKGVASRFNYRVGAESSLGYALKVAGSTGGWYQGGTTTRSTTVLTTWPSYTGLAKRVFRSAYDYGRYYCLTPPATYTYKVQAISYAGGGNSYPTSHRPQVPYCTPTYGVGYRVSVIRNKNLTFSNGASLASIIGIDVSAQSGYSTEVNLDFRFKAAGRRLCGSGANPVNTQGRAPGWVAVRV